MITRGINRGPTGRPVFVRRAAKDYPTEGIQKGQSYWHWQRPGEKLHRSLTRPTCCPHCGMVIGVTTIIK